MKQFPPAVMVVTVILASLVAAHSSFAAARRPREARAHAPGALHGGASSLEELVDQFLRALSEKNQDALRGLRVSEREYRTIILPGSVKPGEPPRRLASDWTDFAWGSLNTKSSYGERGLVSTLGGKKLAVKEIAFDGGETQYAGYKAYRQVRLTLFDDEGGEELSIETGSIAEVGGRYKFIAFKRD